MVALEQLAEAPLVERAVPPVQRLEQQRVVRRLVERHLERLARQHRVGVVEGEHRQPEGRRRGGEGDRGGGGEEGEHCSVRAWGVGGELSSALDQGCREIGLQPSRGGRRFSALWHRSARERALVAGKPLSRRRSIAAGEACGELRVESLEAEPSSSAPSSRARRGPRFVYAGAALKRGRVLELGTSADEIPGRVLLDALSSDAANADLALYVPFFYSHALDGWTPLTADALVAAGPARRVEVMLERKRAQPSARPPSSSDAGCGFFGVGVLNPKTDENIGTLWRSAYQCGASFVFTIGMRHDEAWKTSADTTKAWRNIPAHCHDDWAAFCAAAPYNTPWVAVEMGGVPLASFEHPERAIYLLGAEDHGLPPAIVRQCSHVVSLEAARTPSYNVAVAGSLVMYDRLSKRGGGSVT